MVSLIAASYLLQVTSVVLELGSSQVCRGILVWTDGGGSVASTAEPSLVGLSQSTATSGSDVTEWNRLRILSSLRYSKYKLLTVLHLLANFIASC